MAQDIFGLERRGHKLASLGQFVGRLALSLVAASLVIGLSLGAGIWGYCTFEGMSLIDGFLNAAMILSGMGPVAQLNTPAGKIFAGCYALYSGLALVATTGIILAPVVHRLLHHFHIEDEKDGG